MGDTRDEYDRMDAERLLETLCKRVDPCEVRISLAPPRLRERSPGFEVSVTTRECGHKAAFGAGAPRRTGRIRSAAGALIALTVAACGDDGVAHPDAGGSDAGQDGGVDAGPVDGGVDAPGLDAGADVGVGSDAGLDAAADGAVDAPSDGGLDAGRDAAVGTVVLDFDFEEGADGWEAVFSDYPAGEEDFYELVDEMRALPAPLDTSRSGFYLSGNNHSDDLWMSIARRLTPTDGVEAGATYTITFDWSFATNAASGCIGIGGAPGESVYMKVGASSDPATVMQDGSGSQVFSLGKGNQSQPGDESTSAGDVASGLECPDDTFVLLDRSTTHRFTVTATDAGELTVFLGTDSGFEGTTEIYYDRVRVTLTPTG